MTTSKRILIAQPIKLAVSSMRSSPSVSTLVLFNLAIVLCFEKKMGGRDEEIPPLSLSIK